MKLYTEEQVRKVLWEFGDLLFNNCQHGIKEDDIKIYSDWAIEDEATIELPSDEEIEKAANTQSHYEGAMWFKYKILQPNL